MTESYKWLRPDQHGTHSGFRWEPGVWHRVNGPLEPCRNGVHVVTRDQAVSWIADELWTVEVDPRYKHIDAGDKTVVRRARIVERVEAWNDHTARLFAADCAGRVLPVFEAEWANDLRPQRAVEVARRHANGDATDEELAAAWAAAWAAGDAAWAAWDAAGAARAAWAAWAAAGAAGDAAWDAAGAARAAWAAWAAAGAAAEAAAGAAGAAWAAAEAAAGAAGDAADAARDAERAWQTQRLWAYIDGDVS